MNKNDNYTTTMTSGTGTSGTFIYGSNISENKILTNNTQLNNLNKYIPEIEKVVFVDDIETRVFWKDKTQTIVRIMEGDEFNPYDGIAWAIAKKYFGDNKKELNQILKEKSFFSFSKEKLEELKKIQNILNIKLDEENNENG